MPEAAALKESVEVPFEHLEGAQINLERIEADEAFAQTLAADVEFRQTLGILERTPTLEELKTMMADFELVVWRIKRKVDQQHRGYVGFVSYDGPPYIAFHSNFPEEAELWGQEVIGLLLPVFFGNTYESALFIYPPKPLSETLHALLIEGGFDHWDDNPTMNRDLVTCYFIERHTYEAYYGESGDEFEEYGDEDHGY